MQVIIVQSDGTPSEPPARPTSPTPPPGAIDFPSFFDNSAPGSLFSGVAEGAYEALRGTIFGVSVFKDSIAVVVRGKGIFEILSGTVVGLLTGLMPLIGVSVGIGKVLYGLINTPKALKAVFEGDMIWDKALRAYVKFDLPTKASLVPPTDDDILKDVKRVQLKTFFENEEHLQELTYETCWLVTNPLLFCVESLFSWAHGQSGARTSRHGATSPEEPLSSYVSVGRGSIPENAFAGPVFRPWIGRLRYFVLLRPQIEMQDTSVTMAAFEKRKHIRAAAHLVSLCSLADDLFEVEVRHAAENMIAASRAGCYIVSTIAAEYLSAVRQHQKKGLVREVDRLTTAAVQNMLNVGNILYNAGSTTLSVLNKTFGVNDVTALMFAACTSDIQTTAATAAYIVLIDASVTQAHVKAHRAKRIQRIATIMLDAVHQSTNGSNRQTTR